MTNVADFFASDAGPIPVGWDASTVGAEFDVRLGKMLDAARNVGEPKPYLGNRSVQWGEIDVDDPGMVPLTRAEQLALRLRSGDLLVCEGGEVGRAAIWRDQLPECYYQKALHRLRPRNAYSPELMAAYLRFWSDRGALADYVTQTSIAHLPREKLVTVPLPRPPATEQRAITAALSDVDALLAKIDQLIAKKRDLKQAAMQQLLTGRTRLPGFSDPWREQAIGELAEIVSGATPRTGVREYWDGGIPWCTPTDITASTAKFLKETDRTLTAAGLAACSARLLPAGALLLCTRATVGEVKIAAMPVCTNQGFKSLVCRGDLHNEYLYYQLLTMRPRMLAKASGSTFPELSRAETAALQLPVPSPGEQRAIAQVLADIDDELVALEARRDKTRQLKQGMMQALLTGRIRLV